MYCNDCKRFFPNDETVQPPMDTETGFIESRCPYCGSEWIVASKKCDKCWNEVPADKYPSLCDECFEEFRKDLNKLYSKYEFSFELDFSEAIAEARGWNE